MKEIDVIMESIKTPESIHEKGVIYASELAYCQRKTYYKLNGMQGFHSFPVEIKLSQGNALHELYQKNLMTLSPEELGYNRIFVEVNNRTEGIHGRMDVLLVRPDKKLIIEIKTVEKLPKYPLAHHYSQINAYMRNYALNGSKYGYEVEGMLLYVQRDGRGSKVYEVKYSEEQFQRDLKRARETLQYYNDNILPPPTALLDKDNFWECNNCPFLLQCRSDYNPPKQKD